MECKNVVNNDKKEKEINFFVYKMHKEKKIVKSTEIC